MTGVRAGVRLDTGLDRTDPVSFRTAMRQHAAGVAVITTDVDGPVGFCATSLVSVSLDPPMVSFAVAAASASGHAWRSADHGIVHLLRGDRPDTAETFARPARARFGRDTPWRWGTGHLPVLDDVVAWLRVRVAGRVGCGDHTVVLCDVVATHVAGGPALVRHDGRFHSLGSSSVPSC